MATGLVLDQEIGLGGRGISQIDMLSPRFIGEERITLALDDDTTDPIAGVGFLVTIDTAPADVDGGLVGPFEVLMQTPTGAGFTLYELDALPSALTFIPVEAGLHLVRIREKGHNRWRGTLSVIVDGDSLAR